MSIPNPTVTGGGAGTGHGTALRMTLQLAAPAVRRAAVHLWRPQGLRRRYLAYLLAMHEVIRASVPLMELAAAGCDRPAAGDPVRGDPARGDPVRGDPVGGDPLGGAAVGGAAVGGDPVRGDPVRAPLRAYLAEHIPEERDHDDWLLADLVAAGGAADRPGRPPGPLAARLVGPQYYWIAHWHPVCLLGYIGALEGNPPSPLLADHLAAATGLCGAAFRTLRHHAQVDAGHSQAVFDLLDRLPLTAPQQRAVRVSGLHTMSALTDLFDQLGAIT
jgi:hypothetical protein